MATNVEDSKRSETTSSEISDSVKNENCNFSENDTLIASARSDKPHPERKISRQEIALRIETEGGHSRRGSASKGDNIEKGETTFPSRASCSSVREQSDSLGGTEDIPRQRPEDATTKVKVKSTSEEEIALQGILNHFHSFSFDKAKEQAEKERDASRNSGSQMWQALLGCMVQFVQAEKLYMNMSFLLTKGFLRKEISVRAAYESLITELEELSLAKKVSMKDSEATADDGLIDHVYSGLHDLLRHLCGQLLVFTRVRLKMISLYPLCSV